MWLSWAVFVMLCCVAFGAEMSGQDLKDIEAMQLKNLVKHQVIKEEKELRRRGKRTFVNETTPDESHLHPYIRKGIVHDVLKAYSEYRKMILLRAGSFWKGTNDPQSTTGEYPLKYVSVKSFYLDANPVINADFWAFKKARKYLKTDAEKKDWSWVVDMFLSDETRQYYSMKGANGWAAVKRAWWQAPEGRDSNLDDRWNHPVVHVSWSDAKFFCEQHGKRLPTEEEWEYAAKIAVTSHAYPWGDDWEKRRANVWQGDWPTENRKVDGYSLTSPVNAYKPQNLAGFYDLIGNVWEWTSSAYVEFKAQTQPTMAVLKGGSYVDSVSGKINLPVRNGQRTGQKLDYSAANVGFRCAKSAPHEDEELDKKRQPPPTKAPMRRRQPKFFRRKRDEL